MDAQSYIGGYVAKARAAQAELESYTQEQADRLVREIAKTVYENAEELSGLAVSETGMGNVPDKIAKCRSKASVIWNSLRGKPSVGVISRDPATGITKIAKPVGVVAALTPVTNPVVTPMSNAMFAVKCRNAVIVSPNHSAMRCSGRTVECIMERLRALGAPEHLIQVPAVHSRENTGALMAQADLVLATGGGAMVRAAYSSGTPAYGVGAGNVQCIIDRGADLPHAVAEAVKGRAFDYGILCTAEQSLIVPREQLPAVWDAVAAAGGAVLDDPSHISRLRDALFPGGAMNKALIGKSANALAAEARLCVPAGTRVLAFPVDGTDDVLGGEKMFPALSVYTYDTFDEAIAIARRNLARIGEGHSVCIHSQDRAHIEQAACALHVSRVVVNQCCALSGGGSFYNGLTPTNTLGCGTWGGNSLSENLGYFHLMNITRVADFMPGNRVPDGAELWG
ncbi:aldehyde dehydrogenase family protein [Intestinibacillus massiliensis]|nr:aldehyde dehydrogenase family protein [Intestinibacillus massiliensis]